MRWRNAAWPMYALAAIGFCSTTATAVPRTCVQEKHCVAEPAGFRPNFSLKDHYGNHFDFSYASLKKRDRCERTLDYTLHKLPPCGEEWKARAERENRMLKLKGKELLSQLRIITVTPSSLKKAGARFDGQRVYGFRTAWTRFFTKLLQANPRAVFVDYQFARRNDQRDAEEAALLAVLERTRRENRYPVFACTPWGEPGDPRMAPFFRWGSCAHDLVTLEDGRESRAARYCAHGPAEQFVRKTPLLVEGREYLAGERDCVAEHRPVVVNLLEALGFPVAPEQFHRTLVRQGEQAYRALAVPREVTQPHWNLSEVLSPEFPASRLAGKILFVGDEIPGNDVHVLEGKPVYGIYNHVNTLRALLRPASYASTQRQASPLSRTGDPALASGESRSRLGP